MTAKSRGLLVCKDLAAWASPKLLLQQSKALLLLL